VKEFGKRRSEGLRMRGIVRCEGGGLNLKVKLEHKNFIPGRWAIKGKESSQTGCIPVVSDCVVGNGGYIKCLALMAKHLKGNNRRRPKKHWSFPPLPAAEIVTIPPCPSLVIFLLP
jgi:hypothetical protein